MKGVWSAHYADRVTWLGDWKQARQGRISTLKKRDIEDGAGNRLGRRVPTQIYSEAH